MMTFWRLTSPVAAKDWGASSNYMQNINGCIKGHGATNAGTIATIATLEDIYNKIVTLAGSHYVAPVYAFSERPTIHKNNHDQYNDTRQQLTNHFVIDVDSLDLPLKDPYDITEIGKAYAAHLHLVAPEYFPVDLSFVIVASGSMWKDVSKVKFHIHFLLETPTTVLHMKQLINSYPELSGDPAIYSAARLLLCAPPINSTLPTRLLDMKNRVAIYKGTNDYVKDVHTLPPCLPSKANADFRGYAAIMNLVETDQPKTLLEVLPYLQYNDRLRVKSRLNALNKWHYASKTDGGISIIRSVICTLGRAKRLISPKAMEDVLNDIITNYITNNDKQKSVRSYIENGLSTQFSYTDMLLRRDLKNMPKITYYDIEPNSQGKLDLPEGFGSLSTTTYYLKGSLGVGKTYNIKKKILDGSFQTPVLYIVPLRGIVADVTASMGLTDYRSDDYNGFKTTADADHFMKTWDKEVFFGNTKVSSKTNGICTVLNSLVKPGIDFLVATGFFKTIIIDEADAVLRNIVSLVQSQHKSFIISSLMMMRERARHTVIMDGDLSASTVSIYNKIFEDAWHTEVVTCEAKGLNKVPAYSFMSEEAIIGAALTCAEEGKRILVVSDKGPAWVETTAAAFRQVAPMMNTEVYHSQAALVKGSLCNLISNPPSYVAREMADNAVTCSMSQYLVSKQGVDVLVASPSMVSAQDFVGYFDLVVSINSEPYGMNLRLQAIARERSPKAIFYYIDVDNLSNISYYKQYKPFSEVLEYDSSSINAPAVNADDQSAFAFSRMRRQYNQNNPLDLILLNIDSRRVMEQYNYTLLMRLQLLNKGVIYREVLNNEYNDKLIEKYKQVYSQELKDMYSTAQRVAILTGVPNNYASAEFISSILAKIADYYGSDIELSDRIVTDYLNYRPDLKGLQLKKLEASDPALLSAIFGILGNPQTNWYRKQEELVDLIVQNQRTLTENKVRINHSSMENFVYSIGIPYPAWKEKKEYKSLIPEDYNYQALIKHSQVLGDADVVQPQPELLITEEESLMEVI